MTGWLDLRHEPSLSGGIHPAVVDARQLSAATERLASLGASAVSIDVSAATSGWDVVQELKRALPLPEWCGASWDSVDDSFEELRQELHFPVVLAVLGIESLLHRDVRLELETAIRLSELERAFSSSSDQFVVLYAYDGPAR